MSCVGYRPLSCCPEFAQCLDGDSNRNIVLGVSSTDDTVCEDTTCSCWIVVVVWIIITMFVVVSLIVYLMRIMRIQTVEQAGIADLSPSNHKQLPSNSEQSPSNVTHSHSNSKHVAQDQELLLANCERLFDNSEQLLDKGEQLLGYSEQLPSDSKQLTSNSQEQPYHNGNTATEGRFCIYNSHSKSDVYSCICI